MLFVYLHWAIRSTKTICCIVNSSLATQSRCQLNLHKYVYVQLQWVLEMEMTPILAASLRSPPICDPQFLIPKTMYALCFIFMAKLAKPHTAQLAVLWLHSICMLGRQAGDARCPMPVARKSVREIVLWVLALCIITC